MLKHLQVFGCKFWYKIFECKVVEAGSSGEAGYFFGCSQQRKFYKLIDTEIKKAAVSRDVIFEETNTVDMDFQAQKIEYEDGEV